MSLSSLSWYSLCLNTSRWYLQTHGAHQNPPKTLTNKQLNTPVLEQNPRVPGHPQRLGVGGEAGEADVELVVDLEHPLEVRRDGLQLHPEPPVAGDREAVLPHHRHHGGTIVLEDLRGMGELRSVGRAARPARERGGGGHSPTWPARRRVRGGGGGGGGCGCRRRGSKSRRRIGGGAHAVGF